MAKKNDSWKRQFTTVTRFSKIVALILFVLLPVLAFLFGRVYQQLADLTLVEQYQAQIQYQVPVSPGLRR